MKKQCVLSVVTKSGREDEFVVRASKANLLAALKNVPEGASIEVPIKLESDDKAVMLLQTSETAFMIVFEEDVPVVKSIVCVEEDISIDHIEDEDETEEAPTIAASFNTIGQAVNNSGKSSITITEEECL